MVRERQINRILQCYEERCKKHKTSPARLTYVPAITTYLATNRC